MVGVNRLRPVSYRRTPTSFHLKLGKALGTRLKISDLSVFIFTLHCSSLNTCKHELTMGPSVQHPTGICEVMGYNPIRYSDFILCLKLATQKKTCQFIKKYIPRGIRICYKLMKIWHCLSTPRKTKSEKTGCSRRLTFGVH